MNARYFYSARFFPASRPIEVRIKGAGRQTVSVDEFCFVIERMRPSKVDICVDHADERAGELTNLLLFRGWYLGDFVLDPEVISAETEERIRPGTPLSVGFDVVRSELDPVTGVEIILEATLSEVSLTRRGMCPDAQILSKTPIRRSSQSSPAVVGTSNVAAGEPVPTDGMIVRRNFGQIIGVR